MHGLLTREPGRYFVDARRDVVVAESLLDECRAAGLLSDASARYEGRLAAMRDQLREAADKLDRMVVSTKEGGWSTQNNEPMKALASDLRAAAIRSERA